MKRKIIVSESQLKKLVSEAVGGIASFDSGNHLIGGKWGKDEDTKQITIEVSEIIPQDWYDMEDRRGDNYGDRAFHAIADEIGSDSFTVEAKVVREYDDSTGFDEVRVSAELPEDVQRALRFCHFISDHGKEKIIDLFNQIVEDSEN